jgi:hypothetical protein
MCDHVLKVIELSKELNVIGSTIIFVCLECTKCSLIGTREFILYDNDNEINWDNEN